MIMMEISGRKDLINFTVFTLCAYLIFVLSEKLNSPEIVHVIVFPS